MTSDRPAVGNTASVADTAVACADATAPRVVVADDDGDIRLLMEIAVRRAGLELVASCPDGVAAWDAIQRAEPDLVVLDVSMPGRTGLELCRLIRSIEALASIRILLLSAAVDEASRQAGLAAGADEFMVKPFSPRDLAAHLARARNLVEPVPSEGITP